MTHYRDTEPASTACCTRGADLMALASLLRIPVAMHNMADEQVFRPSAWGLFGAQDPQGADYRACANFGPLYA
ncbi:MAG: hypothetical protein WA117_06630 [Verrucomicrobiia bacterium]